MINVKKPRLLDSNLAEAGVLRPLGLQIQLQTPGVSTATMTLSPDDPEPEMHSWIELYNQNGSVGIFRVTSPTTDFSQQSTLTLRHGIDSLADSVLPAQEDFEGTPTQLLTRMLAAQTTLISGVAPWTLGSCAATNTIKLSLNYNRLSDLLANLEEELEGYFFEYDQSVFPWVINIVSAPSAVDGEFRLNRNVMTVNRTLSDNDLCTQLILSINSPITVGGVTTNRQYIKTYNNTAAQAVYGIVQKTADIDTSDNLTTTTEAPVPATPEADAWAARFLADHAAPTVQIQITGKELYRLTGDLWDESRLGHICRVALPKYNQTFTERVVNVTYPDALGQPDVVNISLANQLPKFSSTIALLRNETARLGRSGRISARNSADAKQLETWSKVVQYYGAALDGTGVLTLYESGIDMNPQGGVTIYSLEEGVQSLYSGIQVNTQAITLKVSKGDVSTQLELECGNVHITGTPEDANLTVDGYVTTAGLKAAIGDIDELETQNLLADYLGVGEDGMNISGDIVSTGEISTNSLSTPELIIGNVDCSSVVDAVTGFGAASYSSGQADVTIPFYTIAHPSSSPAAGNVINFNIAATTAYINGVAAARDAGRAEVNVVKGTWSGGVVAFDPIVGSGSSASPGGGNSSILSLYMNLARHSNASYTHIGVASVNDGTGQSALATGLSHNVYLSADNSYAYISKSSATPSGTSDSNVIAYVPISGGNPGIASIDWVTGNASDYSGWTDAVDKGNAGNGTYYLVTATANDGTKAELKFRSAASSASFSRVNSLPAGKTATTFTSGTLWRFVYTVNNRNVNDVYYRVP